MPGLQTPILLLMSDNWVLAVAIHSPRPLKGSILPQLYYFFAPRWQDCGIFSLIFRQLRIITAYEIPLIFRYYRGYYRLILPDFDIDFGSIGGVIIIKLAVNTNPNTNPKPNCNTSEIQNLWIDDGCNYFPESVSPRAIKRCFIGIQSLFKWILRRTLRCRPGHIPTNARKWLYFRVFSHAAATSILHTITPATSPENALYSRADNKKGRATSTTADNTISIQLPIQSTAPKIQAKSK